MRLLTHNILSSNIKGVTNGLPLRIEVVKVVEKEVELNPDFLKSMFSKIDWNALVEVARSIGYTKLPNEVDPSMLDSDDFLRRFHHALLQLHLEEGALICPETRRWFSVTKGIPNISQKIQANYKAKLAVEEEKWDTKYRKMYLVHKAKIVQEVEGIVRSLREDLAKATKEKDIAEARMLLQSKIISAQIQQVNHSKRTSERRIYSLRTFKPNTTRRRNRQSPG
ncbi:multifunctional methyltransferase subunit TRM112 homolog A-like [Cannabis sativa]|uniref:multifunctional methyltransferase subunit TRM112 homolog A-like n=1 Tax=Cannabis sativa TaxID=3483 RepID=UPI0011DF4C8D|nr:multifunctional methyltransferase subunit TRM112 homolog A-like [Cannabis sativa]